MSVVMIGGMVVGAADVQAACTTTPNCESMGYKYCESECPSGSVACPFDSSKRFCFSPKPYSVAASTCSSQRKNAGSQSCTRGGVTYYNACGSSKCKSGEECKNGSCVSTCTYTYTAESCSSQCKSVGSMSCVKDGTTYYSSCGSSLCSSEQYCNKGTCKNKYYYCCDSICDDGTDICYIDCSSKHTECKKAGRTPVFQYCANFGTSYVFKSIWLCQ